MKKLLILSGKNEDGFLLKQFKKILNIYTVHNKSIKDVKNIIEKESFDFIFMDKLKPVNGDDMMGILSNLDDKSRLRVSIFNSLLLKTKLLKINPFEFFGSFKQKSAAKSTVRI